MECKRDSFSGALGGVKETHLERVSHHLNPQPSASQGCLTPQLKFDREITVSSLSKIGPISVSCLGCPLHDTIRRQFTSGSRRNRTCLYTGCAKLRVTVLWVGVKI